MISHFYLSLVYLASCLLHFTFLLLLVTAFHIPITTYNRYAWHGEDPKARTYGIKSEHLAYNGK